MEWAVMGIVTESVLFSYFIGHNPSDIEPVEDERLLRLFQAMKCRMGMDEEAINLRQYEQLKKGTMRATGLSCCGFTGQITLSPGELDHLNDAQISALFAHELAHLKHYDLLRAAVFILTVNLVIAAACLVLFSLPPIACASLSILVGTIVAMFAFSPFIEFQAEEEAAKMLDDEEITEYIKYHGEGREDISNLSHPNSIRVVNMLKAELRSRGV